MRSFKLAQLAARAELLRLRLLLRRHVVRVVMGGVAAVFLIGMLTSLHVAGAIELTRYVPAYQAVLIVAAVDLVIGIVFMLLAMRDTPSSGELEAMQVRKAAQAQMMEAAALTTLIGPLLRLVGTRKVYGLALAALTARFLGGAR
jgi:hypothetical protein